MNKKNKKKQKRQNKQLTTENIIIDEDPIPSTKKTEEIFLPFSADSVRLCNGILKTLEVNANGATFEEALRILTPKESTVEQTYKAYYEKYYRLHRGTAIPPKQAYKGFFTGSSISLKDMATRTVGVPINKDKFLSIYKFLKKSGYIIQIGQGYGRAIILIEQPLIKIDDLFPVLFIDNKPSLDKDFINISTLSYIKIEDELIKDIIKINIELEEENRVLKLKLLDLNDLNPDNKYSSQYNPWTSSLSYT